MKYTINILDREYIKNIRLRMKIYLITTFIFLATTILFLWAWVSLVSFVK